MIAIVKKELLLFTKNKLSILTVCILLSIYGLILFSNLFNFFEEGYNYNLDIVGLMCLPPQKKDNVNYFLQMQNLLKEINLNELSMGMSEDFIDAAINGSTFLRIGSKIFGARN